MTTNDAGGTGLVIGEGFQTWIAEHQATPLSDELYFNSEISLVQVRAADSDGSPVKGFLWYNKMTNEVDWDPFAKAGQ